MLNCKECSLHKQTRIEYEFTNLIEGNGNPNADVMIIFESLCYSDVKEDRIFTDDRYKRLLQSYLDKVGISSNELYFTSLIKCYISDSKKKPTKAQMTKCFEHTLLAEIQKVKPRVIITVGGAVTKFFIPEAINLRQAVGNYFYSNLYKCYCLPIFSLNYLSNLNQFAPQHKRTSIAFQKIKYLITKKNTDSFDFSYTSKYEDLKKLGNIISVDLETDGTDSLTSPILTIGISDLKRSVVFDTDELDWKAIAPELQSRKIIGQNFIFDLLFCHSIKLDLDNCFLADTRVMQFLINRLGATSLGYMTQVYFGYGYKDEGDITKIADWTKEERKLRCIRDNYFQIRLFYKLLPIIKKLGSFQSFKILSQILPVLADMQHTGFLIDQKRLDELIIDFYNKKDKAKEQFIKKLKLPDDFNLNSPKQLTDVLYRKLDLPVKIRTKEKNESANKKAVELAARSKPVLNKLLEYRDAKGELEKLNLYKESIKSDGRIHSSFNTFSPKSSRAMSAKPNLQNVTKISPLKEIFIAPPGYSLIYYDFKSLEFRLWAIISGDDKAIEFIKADKDIHSYIASVYYKKQEKDVTAIERDSIKSVVYGSIYGADAEAVAYLKNIDVKLATNVQQIFFKLCRKGYFWIKDTEQRIIKEKQVRTPFGTIKYLYDLELARDRNKVHLINSAKNFIIQSWGGEIGFVAMIKIHKAFKAKELDAHYIHNIHDGNIIQIKDNQVEQGLEIVKQYGNNPVKLSAPITIDIKVGKKWSDFT